MNDISQRRLREGMFLLSLELDKRLNRPREDGREPKIDFVMIVADHVKIEDRRFEYISNSEREDMIAMLRECLARVVKDAIKSQPMPGEHND